MPRGDLFPEIGPFETGYLPLSGGHVMYWEQAGNPNGRPVLFLHGGPGAGAGAVHRRFFDPHFWRIVIFDQRGAGRSRPLGGLDNNTTPDLVADIEILRRHLAIERFLLFGGSWGSTLALAYAQAHPDRVAGAVCAGCSWVAHRRFSGSCSACRRFSRKRMRRSPGFCRRRSGRPAGSYLRRLTDPDPSVHLPAARAWSVYEGTCSTLLPSPETVNGFSQDRTALGLARIEAFYFAHGLFLPPGGLLGPMDRIGHIPAEIVQGRYDMICPAVTAFDLAASWRAARMTIVPDAGHSALEPGIRRALVAAVERFRSAR